MWGVSILMPPNGFLSYCWQRWINHISHAEAKTFVLCHCVDLKVCGMCVCVLLHGDQQYIQAVEDLSPSPVTVQGVMEGWTWRSGFNSIVCGVDVTGMLWGGVSWCGMYRLRNCWYWQVDEFQEVTLANSVQHLSSFYHKAHRWHPSEKQGRQI